MAACNTPEKKTEEDKPVASRFEVSLTEAQLKAAQIKLGGFEKKNLGSGIKANGLVDVPPKFHATVSVPMGGFVRQADVLVGDYVNEGDKLAELYHPSFIQLQQEYIDAKHQLDFLDKELARQRELGIDQTTSRKTLEQAEADRATGFARVKALEAHLKLIKISPEEVLKGNVSATIDVLAPISGDISIDNATIGKFVSPEMVLYEIVNKKHLHLELMVYEKDVLKVKKDQKVTFHIPNSDYVETASILLIGKKLDPENRTVSVHAHLDKQNLDLIPGMYVNAKIQTDVVVMDAVPEEAIIKDADLNYIYIRTGEKKGVWQFKKVPVRVDGSENGYVGITLLEEVPVNNNIVVEGAYFLEAELNKSQLEED
ncbi:MAG: efflux RND transporter periplasmic adaptor subunit [Cytophagaceae bacterium]